MFKTVTRQHSYLYLQSFGVERAQLRTYWCFGVLWVLWVLRV